MAEASMVSPPVSVERVWRMAEVLDLYAAPSDPQDPVMWWDERPDQWLREARQPVLVAPAPPGRYDEAYRREGTCPVCMFVPPLGGWRHVKGTGRHTAQEFAQCRKDLVDRPVPQATLISVVLDHLHTPTPAALSDTLTPAAARRLLQQLDVRSTPTHGSWLNRAAMEFAGLATQCLERRIPDQEPVDRRVAAGEAGRNADQATIHWRFTTAKARRKLKRLYPSSSVWSTTRGSISHQAGAAPPRGTSHKWG